MLLLNVRNRTPNILNRLPCTSGKVASVGPWVLRLLVVAAVVWAARWSGGPQVSGSGAPNPHIGILRWIGTNLVLTYVLDDMSSLQTASSITGPWQIITNPPYPYVVPQPLLPVQFFRVVFTNVPCTNSCPE
jgi:hypothetical protein